MPRPKIKITIVDRLGPKGCHRGCKVGDSYDFDTERGKYVSYGCPCGLSVHRYTALRRTGARQPGKHSGVFLPGCGHYTGLQDRKTGIKSILHNNFKFYNIEFVEN